MSGIHAGCAESADFIRGEALISSTRSMKHRLVGGARIACEGCAPILIARHGILRTNQTMCADRLMRFTLHLVLTGSDEVAPLLHRSDGLAPHSSHSYNGVGIEVPHTIKWR